MPNFESSRKKIERANKHIADLNTLWSEFANRDFYSLRIEQDADLMNWLVLEFDPEEFPRVHAAIIIGDTLHNLRSALDILWHEVIAYCGGEPTKYTRFLIRDTREELIAPMNGALKEQQITRDVHDFIFDSVKPYKAGNYCLWAVDDLNVRDKHQLIIPVTQLSAIADVCFEDDQGASFPFDYWLLADESWRIRLKEFYGRKLTVKDKGHATGNILFDIPPFEGQAVIPSLNSLSIAVLGTLESFANLMPG